MKRSSPLFSLFPSLATFRPPQKLNSISKIKRSPLAFGQSVQQQQQQQQQTLLDLLYDRFDPFNKKFLYPLLDSYTEREEHQEIKDDLKEIRNAVSDYVNKNLGPEAFEKITNGEVFDVSPLFDEEKNEFILPGDIKKKIDDFKQIHPDQANVVDQFISDLNKDMDARTRDFDAAVAMKQYTDQMQHEASEHMLSKVSSLPEHELDVTRFNREFEKESREDIDEIMKEYKRIHPHGEDKYKEDIVIPKSLQFQNVMRQIRQTPDLYFPGEMLPLYTADQQEAILNALKTREGSDMVLYHDKDLSEAGSDEVLWSNDATALIERKRLFDKMEETLRNLTTPCLYPYAVRELDSLTNEIHQCDEKYGRYYNGLDLLTPLFEQSLHSTGMFGDEPIELDDWIGKKLYKRVFPYWNKKQCEEYEKEFIQSLSITPSLLTGDVSNMQDAVKRVQEDVVDLDEHQRLEEEVGDFYDALDIIISDFMTKEQQRLLLEDESMKAYREIRNQQYARISNQDVEEMKMITDIENSSGEIRPPPPLKLALKYRMNIVDKIAEVMGTKPENVLRASIAVRENMRNVEKELLSSIKRLDPEEKTAEPTTRWFSSIFAILKVGKKKDERPIQSEIAQQMKKDAFEKIEFYSDPSLPASKQPAYTPTCCDYYRLLNNLRGYISKNLFQNEMGLCQWLVPFLSDQAITAFQDITYGQLRWNEGAEETYDDIRKYYAGCIKDYMKLMPKADEFQYIEQAKSFAAKVLDSIDFLIFLGLNETLALDKKDDFYINRDIRESDYDNPYGPFTYTAFLKCKKDLWGDLRRVPISYLIDLREIIFNLYKFSASALRGTDIGVTIWDYKRLIDFPF